LLVEKTFEFLFFSLTVGKTKTQENYYMGLIVIKRTKTEPITGLSKRSH